jgi:hypothetical protein
MPEISIQLKNFDPVKVLGLPRYARHGNRLRGTVVDDEDSRPNPDAAEGFLQLLQKHTGYHPVVVYGD